MTGVGVFWVDVPRVRQESKRVAGVADEASLVTCDGASLALAGALPGADGVVNAMLYLESRWHEAMVVAVKSARELSGALDGAAAAYEGTDERQQVVLSRAADLLRDPGVLRVGPGGWLVDSRGGV